MKIILLLSLILLQLKSFSEIHVLNAENFDKPREININANDTLVFIGNSAVFYTDAESPVIALKKILPDLISNDSSFFFNLPSNSMLLVSIKENIRYRVKVSGIQSQIMEILPSSGLIILNEPIAYNFTISGVQPVSAQATNLSGNNFPLYVFNDKVDVSTLFPDTYYLEVHSADQKVYQLRMVKE